MKNVLVKLLGVAVVVFPFTVALAAAPLTNGGLGQSAVNTTSFGVAVCNQGKVDVSDAVPVAITANDVTVQSSSVAPLNAGACAYTYVGYDQFNMQAGQTYTVNVSINSATPATYSVTVPGQNPDAMNDTSAAAQTQTADVSTQSTGFFQSIWDWFVGLFK